MTQLLSSGTLKGDDVRNPAGERLGTVEEFMLDLPGGRIAYVVVSFGGFLGVGNKLFAVPPSSFTIDHEDHAVVLSVDKERLKNAPGFDKDHWPDMADARWASSVHEFYSGLH
jgi:hypothetical protein